MDKVTFRVNGTECSVGGEVNSTTTLLEYLRRYLNYRGTKYMCLEGGCGACIVSAVKSPRGTAEGVNSCLVPIMKCQDWEIETIEGIGNRLRGYHPLQTTLAASSGSQCGYCSPGMVMNMYSSLKSKKLTMLEIEKTLASNICRCTGYRPILKAFKTFGSDAPESKNILDIEDLQICKKSGEVCSKSNCDEYDWCFVSEKDASNSVVHFTLNDNRDWYKVSSLSDVFTVWKEKGTDSYMLVAGNTGKGVYPILEYPKLLIDIGSISELKGYYLDQNLIISAGNTLNQVMDIFETVANNNSDSFNYLKVINKHLDLVAHQTVRNLGTLGGNLSLKNKTPSFNSDVFILLETAGAELTIVTALGVKKKVTMQGYLDEDMTGKILLNAIFPPRSSEWKLVTYKIMPRAQAAHAQIHAGFFYKLSTSNEVLDCRIIYGSLSEPYSRASKTESYLIGKDLFKNETLSGALPILKNELVITQDFLEPSTEYRKRAAMGLFYKGLLSLCSSNVLASKYVSGGTCLYDLRPLSNGRQTYDSDPSLWPLNKAMPKAEAVLQCAGEAHYTDDIPTLPKEVFATFALTSVALGTITKIDASQALKEPGVVAFYTAKDIEGENSFTPAVNTFCPVNEEVLCNGEVKYYNQPYGIIVATTQNAAEKAATLVKVTYTNVKKPVIDIKKAKSDSTKVTLYSSVTATKTGNDIAKVIKGENTIYSQYHFPMETLVCVTHPVEEGLKVHSATQWIDAVHRVIHRALKISQNRIVVVVRRLGGAYGIKVSRSSQIAVACSLVAYKLNRPCRFIQSLKNNMLTMGKRAPCSVNFELAVNKNGAIQHLDYELYTDNGYIVNEPILIMGFDLYNNCYKAESWNYKAYNVITDTASNTFVRSPGTLESVAMAETLMERISYQLNLDPLEVRLANLDTTTHGDLLEMAETMKSDAQYYERKAAIQKFNSENRWKKRGLGVSFLRWTPMGGQCQDFNMSVYCDDGTVAITHSGVEMGQGINTRAIQTCAYFLQIPVDKIQIKPNDTMIAPNGYASGGSMTSQNMLIGIRRCCEELLKRLEPIKSQMSNPTWKELIAKAFSSGVDLQVHSYVNTNDALNYHIYGITVAEVEIDAFTGEWQFIRADLMVDAGRSVNPEIDVGQAEGAFIMGVGYSTLEDIVYHPSTGEVLSNRAWYYWVPQSRDIPQDFRVQLRKRSYTQDIILGSKAVGEPATCMGVVVTFALRAAIAAMRLESGIPTTKWFDIEGNFSVSKIGTACAVNERDFKFY